MNEKNDNIYRPKSIGIVLAAVLLILIIVLLIVTVIIFANQKPSDNENDGSGTPVVTTTGGGTVGTGDQSGDNNISGTGGNTDNNNPNPGIDPNAPAVGSASIATNKVYEGPLLLLDELNSYKMSKDLLISRGEMANLSAKQLLDTYNFENLYGQTGGNYQVKSGTGYYLNVDAIKALNLMMAAFASEQGKTDVQVRNAYYYDANEQYCLHATGYVVDLEIFIKNVGTYPLNHLSKKATYYDWFIANCSKYGFIHIGEGKSSTGEDLYSSFRYVGEAHAAYITNSGITLAGYLAEIKSHGFENRFITTSGSGDEWWIYYVAGSGDTTTFSTIGNDYVISGNNTDGFVVAVNASAFKKA